MHVYIISVVIYTTVLTQISKSSSIRQQRCGHSNKKVEEEEVSEVEAVCSSINDSDADEDYIQPSEEEASEASDQDPEDHELQSLLSNNPSPKNRGNCCGSYCRSVRYKFAKNNKRKLFSKSKVHKKDNEPEEAEVTKLPQIKRKILETVQKPTAKWAKSVLW